MIGLLSALALASLQGPAEPAPPNPATAQATVEWARCNRRNANELALRTADTPEGVIAAVIAACRTEEEEIERSLRGQYGDQAPALMARMRQYARDRMTQTISQVRGAASRSD